MLSKVTYLQTEVKKSNSDDDEKEKILQTDSSLQVGDVVVVKYERKWKVLTCLGVVQSVNGEFLQVQYHKGSAGKTFTLKEEGQD